MIIRMLCRVNLGSRKLRRAETVHINDRHGDHAVRMGWAERIDGGQAPEVTPPPKKVTLKVDNRPITTRDTNV